MGTEEFLVVFGTVVIALWGLLVLFRTACDQIDETRRESLSAELDRWLDSVLSGEERAS